MKPGNQSTIFVWMIRCQFQQSMVDALRDERDLLTDSSYSKPSFLDERRLFYLADRKSNDSIGISG